ncbi:MAG: hypothetical protein IV100_26980 [Myxococcales bacterium]|nr:hypothetical protein [Myxococcales bacterium]
MYSPNAALHVTGRTLADTAAFGQGRTDGRVSTSAFVRGLLGFAVVALALGCGRQEPAPIDVARSFVAAVDRLASGVDGASLSAYGLLSTESQTIFIDQATRTNDALPPNLPRLEPHQLFRVRRSHIGPQDEFVEVERNDGRAIIEVRRGEKRARIELKKQATGWRVSLNASDVAPPSPEDSPKPRREGEAG